MKNLVTGILILLSCVSLNAQQLNTGIIKGKVCDNEMRGLPLVTVSLLKTKDSSLVKAELSDENGIFVLSEIVAGSYFLQLSSIGYTLNSTPIFELKPGQTYEAGIASLSIQTNQLKGIRVSDKKPILRVTPDKTIFNVQGSINATGSHALELLQKSPGVSVDNNENITIKGKAGVRIYIDGKMLQLAADDISAYLKNIQSQDIESIEIITNPGAGYDASGNAGVINIRLRKNTTMGANGSLTIGTVQGITPKGNAGVSFNYRNEKFNFYSNVGANIGRYQTDIVAPRIQKDTIYDQRLWQLSYNKSFNGKAGIDYFISTNQTAGLMINSNIGDEEWNSRGSTDIYYHSFDNYIKKLVASNIIPRTRFNINTNLNYRYADTAGREINIDADYGLFRGRSRSFQPNYYKDTDDNLISSVVTRNFTPTDIDIYTAKVDLILPWQKNKFGFGAKLSYIKTNNTFDFFVDENGNISKLADRSYNFVYKENVNAGFLTVERQLSLKWNVRAGIRMEQTFSKGVLVRADGIVQSDNLVKKTYVDWFPNVTVSWRINQTNDLRLSLTRRIDRPNYQSLNPFELKLDELSYVKGNAFLRPQYTNSAELSHTWKNKIATTLSYSHIKDLATQTVDTLGNYTYAFAKNLAVQDIASFNVSAPIVINKRWNGFVNAWVNHQEYEGTVNKIKLSVEAWAYGVFTQQSFAIGNDYTIEVTGWLNGPAPLGPTLKAKSMGGVDLGVQKLFFDKKASLKIAVTDIFHTAVPFRGKTDFGGVLLKFWVTRETQTARLSFSYRFGSNKIKASRMRQSGLETEVQRIRDNQ